MRLGKAPPELLLTSVTPHIDIPIRDLLDVAEARRAALRMASDIGFDQATQIRVDQIVTELANRLTQGLAKGRLLIGCSADGTAAVMEILSIDSGSADGESRVESIDVRADQVIGLGAVESASSEFSTFGLPGRGRVVLSRLRSSASSDESAARWIEHAGVCLAAPRETVSGDAWAVKSRGQKVSVMVADGLGHGQGAAQASTRAIETFSAMVGSPSVLLERTHIAMQGTVGAAISVVDVEAGGESLTFSGAGNIACRVISGVEDRTLMSANGTVGIRVRKLKDEVYPWPQHAVLILHSDGLTSRWNLEEVPGLLRCDPAVIAGWLLRDHTRGNDDLTIVVLKRR